MRKCYKCGLDKLVFDYPKNSIICNDCHNQRRLNLMKEAEDNMDKNKNCIYIIKCIHNDRIYIGSCINYNTRKAHHKKYLENGLHYSKVMQLDYKIYGLSGFEFIILEHNVDNRVEREFELIEIYNKTHYLYNKHKKSNMY